MDPHEVAALQPQMSRQTLCIDFASFGVPELGTITGCEVRLSIGIISFVRDERAWYGGNETLLSSVDRGIAIAGVSPPSRLVVVPGHSNLMPWPSFTWSSTDWLQYKNLAPDPTPRAFGVALQTADSMQIVQISASAPNVSYTCSSLVLRCNACRQMKHSYQCFNISPQHWPTMEK